MKDMARNALRKPRIIHRTSGWSGSADAVESAVHHGLVQLGETVLVLAGAPDRPSGASTDVLRIVRVA